MKLRNKQSGKIYDSDQITFVIYGGEYGEVEETYLSLAELNQDWEEVKPKEPLIKDEKIRKAVRAWAEANGIGGCICKEEIHCITFETERGMFISFEDAVPIPPEGNYTIAELCGDDEE